MNIFKHKKKESFKIGLDKATDKPIPIEKSSRGRNCNVKCADCGQDFIAAQGEINEWHYRHSVESDCKGGQESALHLLAKDIICRNTNMQLTKTASIQYTNPIAEISQEEFRPDITAKFEEENLYFEVVVCNQVSVKKANHYISNEVKSIVIDLSKYEYKNEAELERFLIETPKSKTIIFWKKRNPINWLKLISVLGTIGVLYLIYKSLYAKKGRKVIGN